MEVEQYPWSDSGKELLSNVKALIQHNGGRHLMYCKVKREANKRIYRFKETGEDPPVSIDSIIFNNWDKLSLPEIAKLTGKKVGYVFYRGKWLGLPSKVYNGLPLAAKLILNTETGIYYESTLQAAISRNMTLKNLSRRLVGKRKNNTSFIRV